MEEQEKKIFDDFTSAMKDLKTQVENDSIRVEQKVVRYLEEEGEVFSYVPDYTIFSDNIGVAELYNISTEKNEEEAKGRAFQNALLGKDKPCYVFFYNNGNWTGLHLYCSKTVKQEKSWTFFDPLADFSNDVNHYSWETSIADIVRRMNNCNAVSIDNEAKKDLCEGIYQWIDNNSDINRYFRRRLLSLIKRWESSSLGIMFRISRSKMSLNPKFEKQLFMTILGKCNSNKLYRFTTSDTLRYLLDEKTHAMSSIVCMNDKAEGFYAEDYIAMAPDENTKFKDFTLQTNKDYFITSLTTCSPDNLTMWRLYGENGKGIAIEYENKLKTSDSDCFLAPVSYQRDDGVHKELDFVKYLFRIGLFGGRKLIPLKWNIWQMFFKSKEFSMEKEVRLLWHNAKTNGYINPKIIYANGILSPLLRFQIENDINKGKTKDKADVKYYPLPIKKITLGPLFKEAEENAILAECYFHEEKYSIDVDSSKINIYRNS